MTDIHPDVAAMMDVLDEFIEETDSLEVEAAMMLRESVVELRRRAATLLGLIDTQLIDILESPREFDGIRYKVKKSDGKWRPDHSKVTSVVKRNAAVDPMTGEMFDCFDSAERAIRMMMDLYVAASTMPKVGALDELGLKKWDVAEQEPGKPTLKTTPIVPEVP